MFKKLPGALHFRYPRYNLGDGSDCIPVSGGDPHSEETVEHAEIADNLHMPPIQAKDERSFLERTLRSHLPLEGKLMGIVGIERGCLERTLTKQTTSGRRG